MCKLKVFQCNAMVVVFVLASFLDKMQPIWLSSFNLKFLKVLKESPQQNQWPKSELVSQDSSKLLHLKITTYIPTSSYIGIHLEKAQGWI